MEDIDFNLESDEEEEEVGASPSSAIQITKEEPGTAVGAVGDDDDVMVLDDDDDDEDADMYDNSEAANKFIPGAQRRRGRPAGGDGQPKDGNTVFARVMIENPKDQTLAGKPQEVSLDRGANFNTLLMRMVEQVHDQDLEEMYGFYRTATDEDQVQGMYGDSSTSYDLEDIVPADGEIIYFRPRGLMVGVMHLKETQVCNVLPTHTPADIRERFNIMIARKMALSKGTEEIPKLERGTWLSYNSKRIEEHATLASIGIRADNSETIIVGLHAINVRDDKCGLEQQLTVNEFTSVREVLKQYCQQEQREFRDTMALDNQGSICRTDQLVGELEPKVLYNHLFILVNQMYAIEIKDRGSGRTQYDMQKEMPTVINVEDNWTLAFVKETYSQSPGVQQMLADDKFHIDDAPAPEDVMLCRLRLTEGSVVYVERAEEAVALSYICANCGGEVLLKPADVVKCRRCFHRIMYKRRTPKVCQYNCR